MLDNNRIVQILQRVLLICIAVIFASGCVKRKPLDELIVGKWNLVRYEYPQEKGSHRFDSIGKGIEPLQVEFYKDHTLTSYHQHEEATHGTFQIIHRDGKNFLESVEDTSRVQNEILELNEENFKLDIAGVTTMVFKRVTD